MPARVSSAVRTARADEPGSGECPARALIEWPRWPLASAARDYFRIEDKAGLRFWLFRAGLYRDMARDLRPRWFLHGMYA